MAILSSLIVQLGLDSAQFRSGMKRAESGMKKFGSSAAKMAGFISKLGFGAGVTGATALTAALVINQDALAKTAKEARNLGINVQSLQGLGYAAKVTGVDMETMSDAVKDLSVKLTDATNGAGPFVDFFKETGQNAKEWAAMAPEKQLERFSQELQKMPLDRARFYADEVNDSMFQLSGTLRENGGEFFKLAKHAQKSGLVLSNDMLKAVEDADKEFDTLTATLGVMANHMTAALGPAMKTVSSSLTNWITETANAEGGFHALAVNMAKSMLNGLRAIINALNQFVGQVKGAWDRAMGVFGMDPMREAKENIHELTTQIQEWREEMANEPLVDMGKLLGGEDKTTRNKVLQKQIDAALAQVEQYQIMVMKMTKDGAFNPDLSFFDEWLTKLEKVGEETENLGKTNKKVKEDMLKDDEKLTKDNPLTESVRNMPIQMEEAAEGCKAPLVSYDGLFAHLGESIEGVTGTMVAFGIGNSETMQKAFMVAKAYSVAKTVADQFTAIQAAWASAPFPYNIPAVAETTAATMLNVIGVKGITMEGAKAVGGQVNARGMYQVNEQGLEMFSANGRDYLLTGAQPGNITPAHRIGVSTGAAQGVASMPISVSISTGGVSDERQLVRAMRRASKNLAKAVYAATQSGARNRGVVYD